MQTFSLKTMALIGAAFIATTGSAMANDMINNQASGYIGSNNRYGPAVVQEDGLSGPYGHSGGANNKFNIEVGSITAERAFNNRAEGFVENGIRQTVDGYETVLDVKVGSITASAAQGNRAEGQVRGSVHQFIERGEGNFTQVHVGAIDAGEDGFAINNQAQGTVGGDIYQMMSGGSSANLRVGSITQPSGSTRRP